MPHPNLEAQMALLRWLWKYQVEHGHTPSLAEMATFLERSIRVVGRRLDALRKRGYIERVFDQTRALIITPKGKAALGLSMAFWSEIKKEIE